MGAEPRTRSVLLCGEVGIRHGGVGLLGHNSKAICGWAHRSLTLSLSLAQVLSPSDYNEASRSSEHPPSALAEG